MRRVAILFVLAGCTYVPPGTIEVVAGSSELSPNAVVTFALYCDTLLGGGELSAGGEACRGAWAVTPANCKNCPPIVGGDETLGFIDECGTYTAPPTRPPVPIAVHGNECGFPCPDTCGAALALAQSGY